MVNIYLKIRLILVGLPLLSILHMKGNAGDSELSIARSYGCKTPRVTMPGVAARLI
jgi:hypothetical protein